MDSKFAAAFTALFLCFASLHAAELPDIRVESQREQKQLQIDVDAFVSGALVWPHLWQTDMTLQRWGPRTPICPQVIGLTREKGEYVLSRLSDVARHARVLLDDSQCKRPNLSIIVTPDPDGQIQRFKDYANAHMGGEDRRKVLLLFNRFPKPRPVRVFYNAVSVGIDGTLIGGVQMLPAQLGSRLNKTLVTQDIVAVVEVVDRRTFDGMSMAQLADYVSMLGLAQIDQDTDYSRMPTILKLYSAPATAKPSGATDWDYALLDALYKVRRVDVTAESEVQGMVFGAVRQTSLKTPRVNEGADSE